MLVTVQGRAPFRWLHRSHVRSSCKYQKLFFFRRIHHRDYCGQRGSEVIRRSPSSGFEIAISLQLIFLWAYSLQYANVPVCQCRWYILTEILSLCSQLPYAISVP